MHEVIEAHEAQDGHEDSPLMLPVAVTLSILAVLVAIATLLGHRANTEEIILQTRATDQWALVQAKNIRLHEMQAVADLLATVSPVDKEKAEALREKYLKETERYEKEREEVGEQAKELEKERELVSRRADRYEAGEVILEIALIICSLTLLTKKRTFWLSGIALGLLGLCTALSGFLIH
jgi:cell shape-determining protein MreC